MVVRFESQVHNYGPVFLSPILKRENPETSWFLKNVERMREKNLNGVDVKLEEITEGFYTGLEVAKDPGIWIVWTGFALILLGLYVNFFTYYRRIYVRKGPIRMISGRICTQKQREPSRKNSRPGSRSPAMDHKILGVVTLLYLLIFVIHVLYFAIRKEKIMAVMWVVCMSPSACIPWGSYSAGYKRIPQGWGMRPSRIFTNL